MTITEAIEQLKKIRDKHGDIDVEAESGYTIEIDVRTDSPSGAEKAVSIS